MSSYMWHNHRHVACMLSMCWSCPLKRACCVSHLSESETRDPGVASSNTGAADNISRLQDLPLCGLLEGLVLALILAAQLALLILQLLQLAQVCPVWHVHMPHLYVAAAQSSTQTVVTQTVSCFLAGQVHVGSSHGKSADMPTTQQPH